VVRGINDSQLRQRALERQIDLVGEAIKRARVTWLGAMMVTFVIAAAIFNATMSWNREQINRRARLLGVVSKELGAIRKDLNSVQDLKPALVDGVGELGYLKSLLPPEDSDNLLSPEEKDRALSPLRQAVRYDLETHVRRGEELDTVSIPLINSPVKASDIGIVGGLAVSIIGFWLLATLRRENHAIGEFIKRPEGGANFSTSFSGYRPEENIYAYRSIVHVMVFSVADKESILNWATVGSFLAPPVIFLANHMCTMVMMYRRGLGDYAQPHILLELALTIVVMGVWSKALIYQVRTLQAMQAWAGLVDEWQAQGAEAVHDSGVGLSPEPACA
jgi:hypothetical protein